MLKTAGQAFAIQQICYIKITRVSQKNTSSVFSFVKQTKIHLPLEGKADKKSAALRIFGRRHFFRFVFLKRKEGKAMKKFSTLFVAVIIL